jgi:hypothetical protein
MPSNPGSIVPGFSPEILSLPVKPDESLIFIKGFGTDDDSKMMNFFFVQMKKPVSKLGLGGMPLIQLNPVRL